MLDEKRKDFVTASQMYNVMAGWEKEIEAQEMKLPVFQGSADVERFTSAFMKKNNDKSPLVRDLKEVDIAVSGADLKAVHRFIKMNRPIFSDGMETMAQKIAMHSFISEKEEGYQSGAMQNGNSTELEAVESLAKSLGGVSISATGDDQAFLYDGDIGGTPDGLIFDGMDIIEGIEVKCPIQHTHMKNLVQLNTVDDLIELYPDYYWQCQTGLSITGAKVWRFATYNQTFKDGLELNRIDVKPNQQHIQLLRSRSKLVIKRATKIKDSLSELVLF